MRGMKATVEIFSNKLQKRFSEAVATLSLIAMERAREERARSQDDYYAFNRGISYALKESFLQITVSHYTDRHVLFHMDKKQKDSFKKYVKHNLAAHLAEEIIKSGLFEYEEWENYEHGVIELNVGIFKMPEKPKAP